MRKYRKFAEGGTPALDELASGREKGSFDEDTYARAKRFLERGGQDEAPKPRPKPKAVAPAPKAAPAPTPAPAPAPAPKAAEIPKGEESAPESTGEDTSGPSNLDRVLMGLPVAGGIAGAAKLAQMRRAKQAAETAKAAASKFSQPQARQATSETGRRFGPKAEMEAAESTMRGAVGRKQIQAKRAAAESARGQAETMERNKPVLQATPKKASPRDRTREDREPDYELRAKGGRIGYNSGGKVRGSGCEARGKTRGFFR